MKVLFIGDYSNFHATLAAGLRKNGHQVFIVSNGSKYMDTARDIDLNRNPGIIGGFKYLYRLFSILPKLSGYDIVQLINPNFLELRPGKIRYFFEHLKRQNSAVSLSLAGSDPFIIKSLCDGEDFRYSEFRIGREPAPYAVENRQIEQQWLSAEMMQHCDYIYQNVDGAISCLFEYHKSAMKHISNKLDYVGIPIDTDNIRFKPLHIDDKINIFIGIKREMLKIKGTDRLLCAAREVEHRHPDKCRVIVCENMPLNEYMRRLDNSHILLDQIYSYTPATNALAAMAMGKIVVSGAEQEYYNFIGEHELQPIVNVLPDDEMLINTIEHLVCNKEALPTIALQGRKFVERHNSLSVVTARYEEHCKKIIKTM